VISVCCGVANTSPARRGWAADTIYGRGTRRLHHPTPAVKWRWDQPATENGAPIFVISKRRERMSWCGSRSARDQFRRLRGTQFRRRQASTTRLTRLDSSLTELQSRERGLRSDLTRLQARTKRAKNNDQMILESCLAYRTFRAYRLTGDPALDYVVKVMRFFASVCDDAAVPESPLTPAGQVVPNIP
jgi:hypothetical protein